MNLEEIIIKYLEDPLSMNEEELTFLIANLKAYKKNLNSVKELALLNDLLSREYAPERNSFESQLAQLISEKKDKSKILAVDDIKFGVKREDISKNRSRRRRPATSRVSKKNSAYQKRNTLSYKYVLMAAAVLLLSFTGFLFLQQENVGDASKSFFTFVKTGSPYILRENQNLQLTEKSILKIGDEIFTNDSDSITIQFKGEKTLLELGSRASIKINSEKKFFLNKGNLFVQASKQDVDNPLSFETQSSTMTVIGTKFKITENKGSDNKLSYTHLEVSEGSVKIVNKFTQESVLVQASNGAIVEPQRPTMTIINGIKSFEMNLDFFKSLYNNSSKDGLDDYTAMSFEGNQVSILKKDFSVNCDLMLWKLPVKVSIVYTPIKSEEEKDPKYIDYFWSNSSTAAKSFMFKRPSLLGELAYQDIYITKSCMASCYLDASGKPIDLNEIKLQEIASDKFLRVVLNSPLVIKSVKVSEVKDIPEEIAISIESIKSLDLNPEEQKVSIKDFKFLSNGKIKTNPNSNWDKSETIKE